MGDTSFGRRRRLLPTDGIGKRRQERNDVMTAQVPEHRFMATLMATLHEASRPVETSGCDRVLPTAGHRASKRRSVPELLNLAGQLFQIWLEDEREFAALRLLRVRMDRVCSYLKRVGCNEVLGRAQLDRTQRAYREHRAHLRGNRRQAWALVSRLNALLGPPTTSDSREAPFSAVDLASLHWPAELSDGWRV
jgi:hypothetical protein